MATWRVLQHWINSLPPESCALVSSSEDLTDGRVFSDIIATIERRVVPKFKSAVSGLPRLRLVICHLGETYGYSRLPPQLSGWNAADLLHKGDVDASVGLLQFLRSLYDKQQAGQLKLLGANERQPDIQKQIPAKAEAAKELPRSSREGVSGAPPALEVRKALKALKNRKEGQRRGSTSGEPQDTPPARRKEEVEVVRTVTTPARVREEKPRVERREEQTSRAQGGRGLEGQAGRGREEYLRKLQEQTPSRRPRSVSPCSDEADARGPPPRSRSQARVRRRPRPSESASVLEDRPGWNPSTALEEERKAQRRRDERRRAGDEAAARADEAMRRAGHLDEDFRFVRGLRFQSMFDPTYRPGPGFQMDQAPEPPPNVRSKSRSRSTSPSRRRPLGPGVPLSELQQEEDEERSHSHGRGGRRDDSVRVIDSVRASFDRVLTESQRRREEGYGHLAEDGVVCRLASKSLTGDEEGHVRTDTNEGRRRVLAWLRGLGVRVDKAWLPRCETGLDQSRRSKEGRVAPGRWGDELCNGVMLCELAAILEARDDAARARADLRCIDGRFLLKGTEGKPRCYAQVLHNVERALGVFRRVPRDVNHRSLDAAARIASGDRESLWTLLGDLYDACHLTEAQRAKPPPGMTEADNPRPAHPPMHTCSKGSPTRRPMDRAAGQATWQAGANSSFSGSVEGPRPRAPVPTPLASVVNTPLRRRRCSDDGAPAHQDCENSFSTDACDRTRHSHASPARVCVVDCLPRRSPPKRLRKRPLSTTTPPPASLPLCFPARPADDPPPPITSQQERLVREWLHGLNLDLAPRDVEPPHLLDDPLRNGVLLCHLFTTLEPDAAAHAKVERLIQRHPRSLRQVQDNIARGLWLFKLRRCPPVPARYLSDPQGLLHGEGSLWWGLLWHLRSAYLHGPQGPSADEDEASLMHERRVVEALGYSATQARQLERSLLTWLDGLGLLAEGHYGESLHDLFPLEASLRDGTLLCRLIELLTRRPVPAWSRDPRTPEVAARNVRKAVAALRGWADMGRRHIGLGAEEALINGDWAAILGVLEDMHRAADGLVPRPVLREEGETPYLGGRPDLPSGPPSPGRGLLYPDPSPPFFYEPDGEEGEGEEEGMFEGEEEEGEGGPHEVYPMERGRQMDIVPQGAGPWFDADGGDIDRLPANYPVRYEPQPPAPWGAWTGEEQGEDDLLPQDGRGLGGGEVNGFELSNMTFRRTEDLLPQSWVAEEEAPCFVPFPPSAQGYRAAPEAAGDLRPEEEEEEEEGEGIFQDTYGDLGDDYVVEEEGQEGGGEGDGRGPAQDGIADMVGDGGDLVGVEEEEEVNLESFISGGSQASSLTQREDDRGGLVGLEGEMGEEMQLNQQAALELADLLDWLSSHGVYTTQPETLLTPQAPEWADGVLLATLVQRLERSRTGLQGIEPKPKARATRLQNIRRALHVLKQKQAIPLHLLHTEFDLLEGTTEVLLPLLYHIRKAYGGLRRPSLRGGSQISSLLSST